jgi:ACT domain-containing protein
MRMVRANNPDEGDFRYKSALKSLGSEFEVLMEVEDDEQDITIFIKEESGMINELVMIGCGDEFFILSLLGDIDLKQVAKLSRAIQIDGMEHFQNIDEE